MSGEKTQNVFKRVGDEHGQILFGDIVDEVREPVYTEIWPGVDLSWPGGGACVFFHLSSGQFGAGPRPTSVMPDVARFGLLFRPDLAPVGHICFLEEALRRCACPTGFPETGQQGSRRAPARAVHGFDVDLLVMRKGGLKCFRWVAQL